MRRIIEKSEEDVFLAFTIIVSIIAIMFDFMIIKEFLNIINML